TARVPGPIAHSHDGEPHQNPKRVAARLARALISFRGPYSAHATARFHGGERGTKWTHGITRDVKSRPCPWEIPKTDPRIVPPLRRATRRSQWRSPSVAFILKMRVLW